MRRATLLADPLPDPKTDASLWAAEPKALATGLGCVALVHLRESNPCLIAFIVIAFILKEVALEGRHIRVGQQPEGWALSPAQAGLCQHQGILVAQKEQKSAIDPELFCRFGRTSAALRAQAIHRAANAALVTSAVPAG